VAIIKDILEFPQRPQSLQQKTQGCVTNEVPHCNIWPHCVNLTELWCVTYRISLSLREA